MDKKYVELFWEKVDKSGDCWLWTGATNKKGYGAAWDGKRTQKAHRVSYMLAHGEMPELCVLHRCDVPNCVRPDHLFLGTRIDNNHDMVRKGRHVPGSSHLESTLDGEYIRGVKHHAAKVNPDIVRAMRREYATGETSYSKLAKKYGLALGNAWRIINKVTWKHVE